MVGLLLVSTVLHAHPMCGIGMGRPYGGLAGISCAVKPQDGRVGASLGAGYTGVMAMGHMYNGMADFGLGVGYGSVGYLEPTGPTSATLAHRVRPNVLASVGASDPESGLYFAGASIAFVQRDDGRLTWFPGLYVTVFPISRHPFTTAPPREVRAEPAARELAAANAAARIPMTRQFRETGRGRDASAAKRNAQARALTAYLVEILPSSAWQTHASVLASMVDEPDTYVADITLLQQQVNGQTATCQSIVVLNLDEVRAALKKNNVGIK